MIFGSVRSRYLKEKMPVTEPLGVVRMFLWTAVSKRKELALKWMELPLGRPPIGAWDSCRESFMLIWSEMRKFDVVTVKT